VSSNPCSDIYGGASSFSEPESAGIKSFMESVNNIRVYLSLHSYGQYWLYPWGYTKEQNRDHQRLVSVYCTGASVYLKREANMSVCVTLAGN